MQFTLWLSAAKVFLVFIVRAEYDGNSGQHAWVQVADENNGLSGIADPTRGIDSVTAGNGTYTLYAMK